VEVIDNHINDFDLFDDDDDDDDDLPFVCPSEIQFNIKTRQYLAIIVTLKLLPFIWKNFRALPCFSVDVYVMSDEIFLINLSL
jgi:hypothetical protein